MKLSIIAFALFIAVTVSHAETSAQQNTLERACSASLILDRVPCQILRGTPTDDLASLKRANLRGTIFQAGEVSKVIRPSVGTILDAPSAEIVASDTQRAAVSMYISAFGRGEARALIDGLATAYDEIPLKECVLFHLLNRNAYVVFMPIDASSHSYWKCGIDVHQRLVRVIET